MRTPLLLSLLAFALAIPAPAQRPIKAHDPVVAHENGTFHLFSTGRRLQHAVSSDLKEWTVLRSPAIETVPQWTRDSVPGFRNHVWAPDILRHRGRWWLAYSCSVFGKNTSAIGLLSADSLGENIRWRDEGPIVCSRKGRDNWNAIDPNFIIDDSGTPWLSFGSFWDGIQLVRLDSTMHIAPGATTKTIARRREGKSNPIEAPFIYRHGGFFYLFVSWDYCCRGSESTYKVVVGRSKTVEGPYTDRDGRPMLSGGGTLVVEGDKRNYEAAGHCSVYNINGADMFFCHAYSIKHDGTAVLITRKIEWDEDGWPKLKEQ